MYSYRYGIEYLAIDFAQYSLMSFVSSSLGVKLLLKTMHATGTCFLYGCGMPTTMQDRTAGWESTIFSTNDG